MSGSDCIICEPPPDFVIGSTELSVATYFPRAIKRGHFVVATKEHLPTFVDIRPEQAADLFRFAHELAVKAQDIVGASKMYIAAIGDKDHHFHIHLYPKLPDDPALGPHIMGPDGWAGEVGSDVSEADVAEFIAALKG